MATFLIVLAVMLLFVGFMAIGLIVANKPVKGSCGGMSALGMETACDVCGGDKAKCEKEVESARVTAKDNTDSLSYDATKGQN